MQTDNLALLRSHGLAEYNTAEEIAFAMGISLEKLRFLTSSRSTSPTIQLRKSNSNLNPALEKLLPAPEL
ncbi:hypothetical protein [Nostoc sp.]|uniref:hypothetical protein n=1 Tax=Nostoc sp. TaxID=1180 RepID=UPI002FF1D171